MCVRRSEPLIPTPPRRAGRSSSTHAAGRGKGPQGRIRAASLTHGRSAMSPPPPPPVESPPRATTTPKRTHFTNRRSSGGSTGTTNESCHSANDAVPDGRAVYVQCTCMCVRYTPMQVVPPHDGHAILAGFRENGNPSISLSFQNVYQADLQSFFPGLHLCQLCHAKGRACPGSAYLTRAGLGVGCLTLN